MTVGTPVEEARQFLALIELCLLSCISSQSMDEILGK